MEKLTSGKFQTYAYYSSTSWSSHMEFWQQFEVNELYICTKYRGNKLRDLGFRTQKPLQKFGVKYGLIQKRLNYGKKYFTLFYVLKYLFIPNNLIARSFFIFFLFFS